MKVGIIVDNPQRDLAGCLALANELKKFNFRPILIPSNLRFYEIGKIKPNYVLFPNLRWPNVELAKYLKNNGVKIGIIDSEGGFVSKTNDILRTYDKNINYKNLVDNWFFWGPKFYASFINHLNLYEDNCHIVGNPKFDLYKSQKPGIERKKILIATGFPLYNNTLGKNKTWKSEIKHNIKEDELTRVYQNQKKQFFEVVQLINDLTSKYPDYKFVLRPHPFENIQNYIDEVNVSNLIIDNKRLSHQELLDSSLLIHFISSLAFEASLCMLNNVSIKNMVPNDILNSSNPLLKLTTFVDKKEDLVENLEKFLFIRDYSDIDLGDYVFKDSNLSSSKLISSIISRHNFNTPDEKEVEKLIYGFISDQKLSLLKYLIRKFLNIKLKYRFNLRNRVKAWKKTYKYFSIEDVNLIINDVKLNNEILYFDKDKISIEVLNEK